MKKPRKFWSARWARLRRTCCEAAKNCGANYRWTIRIMKTPEDPLDALLRERNAYAEDVASRRA